MNDFFGSSSMGAHGWIVVGLLALISFAFFLRFVVPAFIVGHELRRTLRRLASLQKEFTPEPGVQPVAGVARVPVFDPARIGREAMQTPRLAQLWREYAQTLHAEMSEQGSLYRWRATVLAESFFTEHALVDTPLKTEFYKHLPGILTGIGILGTFSGLIFGLADFSVGSDAAAVRGSLNTLIQSVGNAFRISAAAIGLAMLFTWIEKSLVSARYRQVAELTQRIDSCFEFGAGEDYLARLVRVGERGTQQAAQQAARLEQALAGALRQAFSEIFEQQHEARLKETRDSAGAMAATLTQAVSEGLRAPLAQIAATLERAGSAPGEALAGTLGERFAHLDQSLSRHTDDAQSRWSAEIDALRREQRESLAQQGAALTQAVARLHDIGGHIHALSEEIRNSGGRDAQRAENMAQSLSVDTSAFRALCGDLAQVGSHIAAPVGQLAQSSERIGQAAAQLATAAADCAASVREHNQLRGEFSALLGEVRATLDRARHEAGLAPQLAERLESGAKALGAAQKSAEQYLQGVSEVLTAAHEAFARNVERTLREGNGQFHREVAEAVGHLRAAIDELGDTLDAALSR
ncbi:MAG: hypothetical protein FWD77_06685 [Betaproteobacteria bacterium]|nr:hypothetical protein [Betaproteobacteria bacterium]